MTANDTKYLLACISAYFPGWKVDDVTVTFKAWHRILEKYPKEAVFASLDHYVLTDTTGFAPTVGRLLQSMTAVSELDQTSELSEWAIVSKAAKRSAYYAQEEFDKLPDILKKAVGSPSQLREWAMMDSETVESVGQAQFLRSYRIIKQREEQKMLLTGGIAQNLVSANENKAKKMIEG